METYGVTFEDFQSDWGIDYYREIENDAIPHCRESLAHYETLVKEHRANLERVKQASTIAKSLIRLTKELRELADGKQGEGDGSFHDLLSCPDVSEEQQRIEGRANAVARIESWVRQTCGVSGDIEDVFGYAKEVLEFKVDFCERNAREWKAIVDFYEKSLEAQRYQHGLGILGTDPSFAWGQALVLPYLRVRSPLSRSDRSSLRSNTNNRCPS